MSEPLRAKWLRRLLESNVLAMGGWATDGRFASANDALLKLIGYSRKELESGAVRHEHISPPEYTGLDLQALREAQMTGECVPYEKELLRKDGSRVPVLVGGITYSAGKTNAGAFFAVDLTHAKRASIARSTSIPPEVAALSDRQRAICLLLSYGELEKRISGLLDISLRMVELEKHRVAKQLNIPTAQVVIWTVENREALLRSLRDKKLVPDVVADIVNRVCHVQLSS